MLSRPSGISLPRIFSLRSIRRDRRRRRRERNDRNEDTSVKVTKNKASAKEKLDDDYCSDSSDENSDEDESSSSETSKSTTNKNIDSKKNEDLLSKITSSSDPERRLRILRSRLQHALVETQRLLLSAEETYFDETHQHGNVFRPTGAGGGPWADLLDGRLPGTPDGPPVTKRAMPESYRWFSGSSFCVPGNAAGEVPDSRGVEEAAMRAAAEVAEQQRVAKERKETEKKRAERARASAAAAAAAAAANAAATAAANTAAANVASGSSVLSALGNTGKSKSGKRRDGSSSRSNSIGVSALASRTMMATAPFHMPMVGPAPNQLAPAPPPLQPRVNPPPPPPPPTQTTVTTTITDQDLSSFLPDSLFGGSDDQDDHADLFLNDVAHHPNEGIGPYIAPHTVAAPLPQTNKSRTSSTSTVAPPPSKKRSKPSSTANASLLANPSSIKWSSQNSSATGTQYSQNHLRQPYHHNPLSPLPPSVRSGMTGGVQPQPVPWSPASAARCLSPVPINRGGSITSPNDGQSNSFNLTPGGELATAAELAAGYFPSPGTSIPGGGVSGQQHGHSPTQRALQYVAASTNATATTTTTTTATTEATAGSETTIPTTENVEYHPEGQEAPSIPLDPSLECADLSAFILPPGSDDDMLFFDAEGEAAATEHGDLGGDGDGDSVDMMLADLSETLGSSTQEDDCMEPTPASELMMGRGVVGDNSGASNVLVSPYMPVITETAVAPMVATVQGESRSKLSGNSKGSKKSSKTKSSSSKKRKGGGGGVS